MASAVGMKSSSFIANKKSMKALSTLVDSITADNRKGALVAVPPTVKKESWTMKKEKMERELRARGGMSKKGCQLHFADQAEAEALTGFVRNAVTPLGIRSSATIPLFLSHHIPALKEGYFWLGGGAINLKLGVRTDDFVSCLQPVVADVTFKEGCETGVG